MKDEKFRIGLYLSCDLYDKLKVIADKLGIKPTDVAMWLLASAADEWIAKNIK